MNWRNSENSWGRVARWLHWLMALLILFQLTLGWMGPRMAVSPTRVDVMTAHKSLGITLLILLLLRLLWRWTNPLPRHPEITGHGELRLARWAQRLMYALLAAICLVGWAAASATILPWRLWWLMPMPALVATDTAAHEWWAGWHQGLVWAFLVLLTGHVLAALRHQFILKNRVLLRMWKGLLLATVLIACPVLTAQGQERTFHSNGGELRFTARYEDQALMGVFHEFRARLSTDAGGAPLDLRVEVSTGSADMNDADVNSALTESDWFDVEAFPLAVFSSDTMEHLSGNDFLARGRLDLKGRESPLSFTFSLREENGHPTLSGRAELSRLAWNVGAGEWAEPDTIADTVSIEFRVRMEPGR